MTVVLHYLAKLGPPEKLSLKNLTLKVVMLMELLSGQCRHTLHTLSIDCMQILSKKFVFPINSLMKTSRPGKHLACVEFQAYAPDVTLCTVKHVQQYRKHTDILRGDVKQFFISYPCYVSRVEEHTRALKMEGTLEHFNEHAHAAIPLYTISTYRTTYHLLP